MKTQEENRKRLTLFNNAAKSYRLQAIRPNHLCVLVVKINADLLRDKKKTKKKTANNYKLKLKTSLKFDFLHTVFHISLISQSYVEIVANVMQVCDLDLLTRLTTTNSEDRRVTP